MSAFAAQSMDKNTPEAKQWVHKITDDTGSILQNIRDIVWTMNPENDKAEEMISRMKHFAVQTLEPKSMQVDFDIDSPAVDYLNTLSARRNIFLIFKEAVNNAVKYSGADRVGVSLKMMNGESAKPCAFTVRDNGKGFNQASSPSGNGIRNMRNRAVQLGGSLDIQSTTQGTQVIMVC